MRICCIPALSEPKNSTSNWTPRNPQANFKPTKLSHNKSQTLKLLTNQATFKHPFLIQVQKKNKKIIDYFNTPNQFKQTLSNPQPLISQLSAGKIYIVLQESWYHRQWQLYLSCHLYNIRKVNIQASHHCLPKLIQLQCLPLGNHVLFLGVWHGEKILSLWFKA